MTTHSSILAWRILQIGEPSRLQGCKQSNTTEATGCMHAWQFYFQFFKKPPYYFTQWLDQFTFPPTFAQVKPIFLTVSIKSSSFYFSLHSLIPYTQCWHFTGNKGPLVPVVSGKWPAYKQIQVSEVGQATLKLAHIMPQTRSTSSLELHPKAQIYESRSLS